MSNVSNVHQIVKFDSKTSKAFSGQRLSKVIFKSGKNVEQKLESKCASVPVLVDSVVMSAVESLKPYILEMVQDAQDGILRELVISGKDTVSDSDIGMNACVEFLKGQQESGRLSKESVGEWFNASLSEILSVAIADKLGVSNTPTDTELGRINLAVGTYKERFIAMAGGRTRYTPEVAVKLVKVLELVDSEDEIASRFKLRLQEMVSVKNDDLLLNL